jgi:hypothetical protein
MLGTLENLLVIVLREVARQLVNPTQVDFPACDHAQNAGKTTGRATCSDAPRRNCFGHVKARRAESEHRGARVLEIQFSSIDLRDVREQRGRVATVFLNQGGEVAEQMFFVEIPKGGGVRHEADANMRVQNPRMRS